MFYPISEPYLGNEERENLIAAYDSGWISSHGKFITQFEKKFAQFCHRKHATSVCNGTAAIHLALMALGIKPGDEVIVPSLTFVASVNPIQYMGAQPVFVDIDPESLTLDPEDFKAKITPKTKAVIVVPVYGHAVDYDSILAICEEHDIKVIEDAAEGHGSRYKGKILGQFGDISCFSFFGNKIMTTGEGGMVLTDDQALIEKLVLIKNHGMDPKKKYIHPVIGNNFRMTNLQAAIGCAQLDKIEKILKKRKKIASWYSHELKPSFDKGYIKPQPQKEWAELNYWFFSLMLIHPKKRAMIIEKMRKLEVDIRPFFYPIHEQEPYKNPQNQLKHTTEMSQAGINLPTHPGLKKEDIQIISNHLNTILDN